MHVLLLNQTFHPDVAATAQHLWDLARHLRSDGHRVTVVTARNFYGTDRQHAHARETIEGIDVHRVRGTALGKASTLRRLTDFATFYLVAALRIRKLDAPDVVIALTSPPMIGLLGMATKALRRTSSGAPVRFIYYAMDMYPDAQVASGMLRRGAFIERVLRAITARTLEAADAIIVLGRDMEQLLLERYKGSVSAERIRIVRPWADAGELHFVDKPANPLAAQLGLDGVFTIVHSGNFGIAHDADTIVEAIRLTETDGDLAWVFIGGGRRIDEIASLARDEGWKHVRFLPYQERDALNLSLNLGDAHLVTQLPAFTGVVVPSKLFGILAVGRPVLMVGPASSECARIVSEHGAGFAIANGDAAGLAARVRELRDDPPARKRIGLAARRALETRFDRGLACAAIEDLILTTRADPARQGRIKEPAGSA